MCIFAHQRFVPSEFGNEVDRVSGLPPFEALLANKRKIRRATEEAGISYTYVSANSFAAYFVDYLLHPHENRDEVVVYGSGEAKGRFFSSLNYVEFEAMTFYEFSKIILAIPWLIILNFFFKWLNYSLGANISTLNKTVLFRI